MERQEALTVLAGKTYLTRRQVAQIYPISEHTLAKLASLRQGPRYFKPTDKVLYLPADIEAWIEAAAVVPVDAVATAKVAAAPRQTTYPVAKGRGRAKPTPRAALQPGATGRHLKSLPPSPNSWLRRKD
jgi:hypothetical protein